MHSTHLSNVSIQEFDKLQTIIACNIYSKATEYKAYRTVSLDGDNVSSTVVFSKGGEYVTLTFTHNNKILEAEIHFDVAFVGTIRQHEDFIEYVKSIVLPEIKNYVATSVAA